jgi:hypothetical protein
MGVPPASEGPGAPGTKPVFPIRGTLPRFESQWLLLGFASCYFVL